MYNQSLDIVVDVFSINYCNVIVILYVNVTNAMYKLYRKAGFFRAANFANFMTLSLFAKIKIANFYTYALDIEWLGQNAKLAFAKT